MKLSDERVELARRHNKVVYKDGNRIVKSFVRTKPAVDVFREALNLARIEQAEGLNTPKVLEVSQVEDGSWALAYEYFPGRTLHDLMKEAEGTDKFDELLQTFVDLQVKVQNTKAPAALTGQCDKIVRMIGRVKSLDPSARYDLQMRADRLRNGRSICHGDFNPTNVIVPDDGSAPYVCDWAHVTAGLPEVDAATTYLLFSVESEERAKRYLTLYSKAADIPQQVIMQWVPVVAAAELARGRAEKEEFLRGWIDAVFGDE